MIVRIVRRSRALGEVGETVEAEEVVRERGEPTSGVDEVGVPLESLRWRWNMMLFCVQ